MTKISNQQVYKPDTEIVGKDYVVGTDSNQAKKTVNFRIEDIGSHFNSVNGVRNFDFYFYAHQSANPKPADGCFYSNGNEQDPNNITEFYFSKITQLGKDISQFFQSIETENPFDLVIAQKTGVNSVIFFQIDNIEIFNGYYKLNVSEVFFPEGNGIEYILSYAIFNLKPIGNTSGNTDLGYIESPTQGTVTSDTGTDANIPVVDFTIAGLQTPSDKQLEYNNASTGLISFDGLSINADNTKFDVGLIKGWFVDNTTNPEIPTKTYVEFSQSLANSVNNIATQNVTYIAINSSGVLQQSGIPFEPEQQRDWIPLGVVIHSNRTNINAVNNQPVVALSPNNQLSDLMESIGFFNISGNAFSPNGANLNINKSAGHVFKQGSNFINNNKDPHTLSLNALVAPSNIRYRLQDGTESSDSSIIDPNFWDNGGTLTAMIGTRWSIQRIYIFQSNLVRIQYGQATYSNQADAIQAIATEAFVVEQNLLENGLFRGLLIVRRNATDLTDTSRALFIEASKFGSVAGLGSLSTTSLQQAYNNSLTPEIITDSTLGAVSIKRGSASDTDNIIEGLNNAGSVTSWIKADGTSSFEQVSNKKTDLEANKTSNTFYASCKAIVDWIYNFFIPLAGITVSGRKMKFNFLSTGLKISSRSDGSEIGVDINTDNLPSDINVQFGVGGGTVAYEGMAQKNITFNDLDNNPYIKFGYNSTTDETGIWYDNGVDVQTRLALFNGGFQMIMPSSSNSGMTDDYFGVSKGTNASFKGIRGNEDFSPNYDDLTYVQKKWVVDNFSKYLLKVITPTAPVTGTTAETVLYTWFVPADTFSTTDRISIDDFTCVSNGTLTGTSLARIRFNTTSTVDISTNNKVFATIAFSAGSGDRYFRAERIVDFIGGKIKGYFNLAGSFTDTFSSVYTSNDFDTTVDNWFFFTIQPADVSNSIYMKNLIITK